MKSGYTFVNVDFGEMLEYGQIGYSQCVVREGRGM